MHDRAFLNLLGWIGLLFSRASFRSEITSCKASLSLSELCSISLVASPAVIPFVTLMVLLLPTLKSRELFMITLGC